jgi:CubicO group peptidase (beta-lactamase class C family)
MSWRNFLLRCLGVALGTAVFAASAAADDLSAVRETVSALARQVMKDESVPGLSLALVNRDGVIWSAGFGWADVDAKIAATPDTVYSAGTLTMPLTAAAVMQLAEHETIDLDAPLQRYLPDFSIRTRFATTAPITPRNLLTHHAGLPAMHFAGMWTEHPVSLAAFVASLRDEYAPYPPDLLYDPSQPGYAVLGHLIETLAGERFAQYMRDHLLAPLGMTHSAFDPARIDRQHLTKTYWRGKKETPRLALRDTPAVGLYCSAPDMGQFLRMLLNSGVLDGQRVLSAESVAEMLTPQNTGVALDLDDRIGLGWRLSGVHLAHARTVAWQSNSSPTGHGRMLLVPDRGLGVVVLSNSSVGARAVDELSATILDLLIRKKGDTEPEHPTAAVVAAPAPVSPQTLPGHYASILGMISVTGDAGHLRADVLGKTLRLEPGADGLYGLEYRFLGLIPIPISALKEVRVQPATINDRRFILAHVKGRVFRFADRVPQAPLSPAWRARLGSYEVVNRDALLDLAELRPIELRYDDGVLYFRYRLPGLLGLEATAPVLAQNDNELVLAGTGWLMGETIRVDRRENQERLLYSGYELRRITP